MFSNTKQSIPKLFKEKISVDKDLTNLSRKDLVFLEEFRERKSRQQMLRKACEKFLQRQAKG